MAKKPPKAEQISRRQFFITTTISLIGTATALYTVLKPAPRIQIIVQVQQPARSFGLAAGAGSYTITPHTGKLRFGA